MRVPSWLACPRCHGPLCEADDALRCEACGTGYPVTLGIPDLRVAPDPWIGPEEDRTKGARVAAEAPPGFADGVRHYWKLTPSTPAETAERHIAHVLGAAERTGEWVRLLAPPPTPGERWLDLGCGTADLAAAVPPDVEVVGVDVAFRWLVLAARRLEELGRPAKLYCGNAEALPIADHSMDRVVLLGTIEHCMDLSGVVAETRRILRPGGILHARVVNRFSLLPEPHVGVWGVGWLPRAWADPFVRWRTGMRYLHHRPRSARELTRALRAGGYAEVSVTAASLLPSEARRLFNALRSLAGGYERIRRIPFLRGLLRLVAPLLEVRATAT